MRWPYAVTSVVCLSLGCSSVSVVPRGETADAGPEEEPSVTAPDGGSRDAGKDAALAPSDGGTSTFSKVVINFDDLPSQTVVTNQYASHATFRTEPGVAMTAENHINIGQSPKNYLSAGSFSDVDHPLYVDFVKPVRSLRFNALSVTSTGAVAHIRVMTKGSLAGTVDLIGKGESFKPVPVDLSSYVDVTAIEVIDITDTYGIVYDDFSFESPD